MIKLKKNPNYLILAILSSLTVFTWIGVEVYNALTKPIKVNIPKDYLVPVKSSFDDQAIEALNQRLLISDQDLEQVEEQIKSQSDDSQPVNKTLSSNPAAQQKTQASPTPTPKITATPTPTEEISFKD